VAVFKFQKLEPPSGVANLDGGLLWIIYHALLRCHDGRCAVCRIIGGIKCIHGTCPRDSGLVLTWRFYVAACAHGGIAYLGSRWLKVTTVASRKAWRDLELLAQISANSTMLK
jgi:hypothetical protein